MSKVTTAVAIKPLSVGSSLGPGLRPCRACLFCLLCMVAGAVLFLAGAEFGSHLGGPLPAPYLPKDDQYAQRLLTLFQPGAEYTWRTAGAPAKVFVGILSASRNREVRDIIRATWGSHPGLYSVRFFLLQPREEVQFDQVQQEAIDKEDIVIVPSALEHYDNLTYQTYDIMHMAAADPAVTHVVKLDDDSYPRWDPLLAQLALLPRERLYWGRMNIRTSPIRKPWKKWHVSVEEWDAEYYPLYGNGAGYVLSIDLARSIATGAALKVALPFFKLEDVSLGSWIERVEWETGPVLRVNDHRFKWKTKECTEEDLLLHKVTPELHRKLWDADGKCSAVQVQTKKKKKKKGVEQKG